jgi:hypothetical protein
VPPFPYAIRDLSTDIRAFHRKILDDVRLTCESLFIGAEPAIKTMLRGYPVGELGIQTFPRQFGSGSALSGRKIVLTIRDIFLVRRDIFSDHYHLPADRSREAKPVDR